MTGVGEFRGQSLEDLADPEIASRYLAKLLLRGELTLLLGAGVSMANSLPSWKELVRYCEGAVGIEVPGEADVDDVRSSTELQDAMEAVYVKLGGEGDAFRELVRKGLYDGGHVANGAYSDAVLTSMLLIAIGALVMPSRRGSVREVITLNFDDLLEWYLHLHGYRTQSVSKFPVYLRSDVDLTVFHPHGFLPLVKGYESSDWIVLRYSEFVARLAGTGGEAWARHMTGILSTKRLLALGTSMGDIDIDVQLAKARAEHSDESLPAGFVVGAGIGEWKSRQLIGAGLVPVSLEDHDAIPTFVLEVCRRAAALDGGRNIG